MDIPEASGGKYLQELLEAFSSDDWGFPEQRSTSQSESEGEQEQEEDEDMATLRARIQAFEQMHDGSTGDTVEPCVVTKPRPEPKPRPRLQQHKPPVVAPKPKIVPNAAPKPSCKGFWEGGGQSTVESEDTETDLKPQTEPALIPESVKSTEKPLLTPKPQFISEGPNSGPVPAPRPSPPPAAQPRLPPRPSVAPRTSIGTPQERGPTAGQTTPPLPPRPTEDLRSRAKTETTSGEDGSDQSGECLSINTAFASSILV